MERQALWDGRQRLEACNTFSRPGRPSEPAWTLACTCHLFLWRRLHAFSPKASHPFEGRHSGELCGNTWLRVRPIPRAQKEALECFSLTAHCCFSLPSLINHWAWNLPRMGSSGSWFYLQNWGLWHTGEQQAKEAEIGEAGHKPHWAHIILVSGSGCSTCQPGSLRELIN